MRVHREKKNFYLNIEGPFHRDLSVHQDILCSRTDVGIHEFIEKREIVIFDGRFGDVDVNRFRDGYDRNQDQNRSLIVADVLVMSRVLGTTGPFIGTSISLAPPASGRFSSALTTRSSSVAIVGRGGAGVEWNDEGHYN